MKNQLEYKKYDESIGDEESWNSDLLSLKVQIFALGVFFIVLFFNIIEAVGK